MVAGFLRVRGAGLCLLISGSATPTLWQRGLGIGHRGELWSFWGFFAIYGRKLFKHFMMNSRIKFVFREMSPTAMGEKR